MERISDWKMSGEIWLTRRLDVVDGMDVCRILQIAVGGHLQNIVSEKKRPSFLLGLFDL